MDVGIRELKAKLSEYVSRAAAGEEVIVTDRGAPVARLVPFDEGSALQKGFDEGWIEAPRRARFEPPTVRFRSSLSVVDVLDEDRG